MAIPTRAEVDHLIRERLAEDPAFRDALVADPRAAVSGLIGIEIPDAVRIDVHEETLTHLHITVPAVADELSEDSLEMVAGGSVCWTNCTDIGP